MNQQASNARSPAAASRHREARNLLGIALPLTAAYVAEMGMVITDMIIVGRLGSNELAAVGLAGDMFWMLLLIGMGIIAMVGVIAAQCLGAGDDAGVIEAGEQGMIVATITSLPIMLFVWAFGPLLTLAQQDPAVVALASSYGQALTLAVLPALWFVVLRNYITALASSAAVGWIMLLALALNLFLNYTLVFGKFGLPALGVVGAGMGTTIVNWLMFAALSWHVLSDHKYSNHRPRIIARHINRPLLGEIFRLGIPNAMTQVLNGGMFTAAAIVVGMLSASILAAQQIIYTVIYLALSAAAAIADAVRVRVAHGIGQESVAAARHSAHTAFVLGFLATVLAALPLLLFPETLVRIFLDVSESSNREVVSIALSLAVPAAIFLLLDGTLMVGANALKGLRDTRSPLVISLIGYWAVGLGLGTMLCLWWGLGAAGLWWGLVAGVCVCNILIFLRFRQRIAEAQLRVRNAEPTSLPLS